MRRRELPGGIPPPTKTELKRQAQAVQELADRLIDAPADVVAGLALPEKLADALAAARRIRSRAALARQRQFIAKLMRGIDAADIRSALEAQARRASLEAAQFRRAERWRDRLLAEGEPAIVEFLAECPAADRATLATLVAGAVAGHSARPSRELFQWIVQTLLATD